jgi:hypothetical protein
MASSVLRNSRGIPLPPPEVTDKMKLWKAQVKEHALKAINETMAQKCLALNERLMVSLLHFWLLNLFSMKLKCFLIERRS